MFALFAFPFFGMIFMTVNAVWTIIEEWDMIRLLNKEYHVEGSWAIIIFASLSVIILWVFYLYNVIKVLS